MEAFITIQALTRMARMRSINMMAANVLVCGMPEGAAPEDSSEETVRAKHIQIFKYMVSLRFLTLTPDYWHSHTSPSLSAMVLAGPATYSRLRHRLRETFPAHAPSSFGG